MAEYIMFGDCRRNHNNKHTEVEDYNADQDTFEDKLVDINMDKENIICEVFDKTHTFHKAIGAQHNSSNRERRSEHAKTQNLSRGTDGNELVDDKCE
eukprot:7428933-Heterocapsa_arctica.AAC.1